MIGPIKIGDTIRYRGGFGLDRPSEAIITGLTVTDYPRDKYGAEVPVVTRNQVLENRVVFSLSNNHWCYSEQVEGYSK